MDKKIKFYVDRYLMFIANLMAGSAVGLWFIDKSYIWAFILIIIVLIFNVTDWMKLWGEANGQ